MDESYFGPTRIRGKRGRGAGGKTIVFGIIKRNGSVFTEIVPDAKKRSLLPVIRGRVSLDT
jgi:transposase